MITTHILILLIPCASGKFGLLGKATAAATAALPCPTSACWVFSCFRNAQNMDYRIFNVYTYMIILVRAYTHRSWEHRQ